MKRTTTIALSTEVVKFLRNLGKKGDTYNDIVIRVLQKAGYKIGVARQNAEHHGHEGVV